MQGFSFSNPLLNSKLLFNLNPLTMTHFNENLLKRLIEKFPGIEEIEFGFSSFINGELYFHSEGIHHDLMITIIPFKDCWLGENEDLEYLVKVGSSITIRGSFNREDLWERI